ncbi:Voltage-gated Ion Channel (VIC) Superfamily [Phytophthora cinnamomi]|uniref:Voltage-gated Ion Channel (VIC) Superfamily n=1 Tax=Phytophthora cinnamomi TaxID=4785 RepID=UPI003559C810|nr:Voltage-gated Ion Channel (VIC) Superfamily [Phytophthora cinnamomi]
MQQSSCQEFVIQGGVGALDEDLLAALDDVLSLADAAPVADAFNVVADETPLFGDELDGILAIEAEALLATDESVTTDKSTTSASRPSVSRSNIAKSPQGATSLAPGKKGKDVRAAPYSKTNKPRRRKRPKDELDYLRAKVADMEEELASLQTKPDVGSPVSAAAIFNGDTGAAVDADADAGVDYSRDVLLSWKRIAERQKKEADRSVVENMRLRAMLEGQLNVARSLEAAIDQHQRDAAQSLPTFNGSGTAGAPSQMP